MRKAAALLALLSACSGPEPNPRSSDPYERYLGAKEMAGNGASNVPEIVKLLEDPHYLAVLGALEALGEIGDKDFLPTVAPLLKHGHPLVRAQACATLAGIMNPDGIPALAETLAKDADASVRRSAAKALASFGPRPDVLAPLVEAVADKDASVSLMAHEKLEELTGKTDLPRSKSAWQKALGP